MTRWTELSTELAHWPQAPRFWWRDDDAVADSAALQTLLALSQRWQVPLHLAVIPALLEDSLVQALQHSTPTGVWVMQHGFSHTSHARDGERKIELGGTMGEAQQLPVLLEQLRAGRTRLQQTFAGRYLDMLVPPWNRVSESVQAALPALGYRYLSVLGALPCTIPAHSEPAALPCLNVHIDMMNWKTRRFAGEANVLAAIIDFLREQRTGSTAAGEVCGLMTHHQVHDADCWSFLERLFAFTATFTAPFTATQTGIRWVVALPEQRSFIAKEVL